MAKKRKKSGLRHAAEVFALSLLFEASGGSIGRVPKVQEGNTVKAPDMAFSDKRALLDSMTKLITLSHKVDPVEEEETDGLSAARERLHGKYSTSLRSGGNNSETSSSSDGEDSSDQ